MRKFRSSFIAAAAAIAWIARMDAQAPLNRPVPLAPPPALLSPAEETSRLAEAQRAHDSGLPTVAAAIYREYLKLPGADRRAVSLALATALLDAGNAAEAEQVLATIPAPRSAAWHLRAGLAALQLRKRDAAQATWNGIVKEDVPPADLPWYYFFTGALYDTATPRDTRRANDNYLAAEASAPTELARARFQLAGEQVRLHLHGQVREEDLRQAQENAQRFQPAPIGRAFQRDYAIMLAEAGNVSAAVEVLNRLLLAIPPQERGERDDTQLKLGLIGDRSRNGPGRRALSELLASGGDPLRQRQALQLLAEASTKEPERGFFTNELKRLIEVKPPHPIADALLYYRAHFALAQRDFVAAEPHAERLVKEFPASGLRVHALALLTQSAWIQERFRLAAVQARRTREALPPNASGTLRAELGVLEAEASFRGGDYRTAADVYAAVIRARPPELELRKVGALMFQCVLAEIRAGSTEAAQRLDEFARDPAFDIENRWQAEWSLAQALKLANQAGAAFERVSRLLADEAAAARLSPALRARMAWLQARLAFESERFPQTLALIDALLGSLGPLDGALRNEISSTIALLKARAQLGLGHEAEAVETLRKLRADHANSDAAIFSHLVEASYFEAKGRDADAQATLTKLTDNPAYAKSEYMPYALYRLALLAEQLGGDDHLKHAIKRIEDLIELVGRSPAHADLVFAARLRQGDLLRRLNQFPQAQQAYEELLKKFPQHGDVVIAQLRLAETHSALASTDGPDRAHANAAQARFEELLDRVDAPPDVRVEAGYNLGLLLQRQGKLDAAYTAWWRGVVDRFLIGPGGRFELGAKRPYWLGRTLNELGLMLEQQGRAAEARRAYSLWLDSKLGSESVARKNLERLGRAPAAPN